MYASEHSSTAVGADILEKMRITKEKDPENLYLAVHYLDQCAKKGERIEDEARELAREVLRNPVSSYSGIKPLLIVYRNYLSVDEAIDLAEEVLRNHPDERYLKGCAALCYKWKIFDNDSVPTQSLMDRAISLHEEMISLYPHSSLKKKIDLADIYAKSINGLAKAEQIYQELLERDLEPVDKQMLYYNYAQHLNFHGQDRNRSLGYHMQVAEIRQQSIFREKSFKVLVNSRDRGGGRMCREIEEFLENLQEP
ncbi:uncharacterized protein LOC115005413 [Cottoperca gobio]|uniref:Uncharacterized protein LOC115005413 n=1 Tax=Cottoperca gobio TaxID=56716 RepID=A0A6J2PAH0_COTGO|nr:uncharacterized protein LOC115005413 [Cottoperca gobio]